jgi:hypothetical protein
MNHFHCKFLQKKQFKITEIVTFVTIQGQQEEKITIFKADGLLMRYQHPGIMLLTIKAYRDKNVSDESDS